MKPGLQPGATGEVTIVVTQAMLAWFEELGIIHPVYATWAMVRHMELASRKVILPFLEAGEDAVGHSVNVTHFAPSPLGARITVRATLTGVEGNRIYCRVEAFNGKEQIGAGETVQVLLPRAQLTQRFHPPGPPRSGA
jgi:predicted thioesterase